MAILSRAIQKIFAETAGVDEVGQIGSRAAGTPQTTKDPTTLQSLAQYSLGWFQTTIRQTLPSGEQADLPASEDFNGLWFLITRQLAYLFQNGIPEWLDSADQRYYANISFVQVNGAVYQALLGNDTTLINSQQMPSETSTWWRLVWSPTAEAFYRSITSATTIDLAVQTPPKTIEITAGAPLILTINNNVAPSGSPLMIHNSSAGIVTLAGTSGLSGTIGIGQTLFAVSTNDSMQLVKNQGTETTDDPTFNSVTTAGNAVVGGELTAATVNTGQGGTEIFAMDQPVRTTDSVTFASVTSSGALSATTVDTGQGANELYPMNQPVQTTSDPTFNSVSTAGNAIVGGELTAATVNTGQGGTEVFAMNQNVRTIDGVRFNGLNVTNFGSRGTSILTRNTVGSTVIPQGLYYASAQFSGAGTSNGFLEIVPLAGARIVCSPIFSSIPQGFFLWSDGVNVFLTVTDTGSSPARTHSVTLVQISV